MILRDIDILESLAKLSLIHVNVSLTTLDEQLRLKLEPRTITATGRLAVIQKLSERSIPVRVMAAPIIPGLNSNEVPNIIKAAADRGALAAGFTIVRLNGSIGEIFIDWVEKAFPDRAEKILNMVAACHGGNLNDSRWGTRMSGEGNIAEAIHQLFKIACTRFLSGRQMPAYDFSHFTPLNGRQTQLF